MPRRETLFISNQYYHFYNRGNNRQAIFFQHENYLYFLEGLRKYLQPHVDVIAYCLMPTHYHMLGRVKQKQKEVSDVSRNISLAMQKFGISYTKAINKRFERVGALFQGQFHGKPVKSYKHLLQLCIYIHANPVKDSLVFLPEEWEFSNYLEWLGMRNGTLVDHEFITENFGSATEYQQLVMDYIKTHHLADEVRNYLAELEK